MRRSSGRKPRVDIRIRDLRGHRVLLDEDLAALYGVEVKVLNQAVKRNAGRFPADFMFRLMPAELAALRSRSVTLEAGRGRHRKYAACAFTEQGVAMLSSVLRSTRAIQVNIEIMRAFVRLRAMVIDHQELKRRVDALEGKYDRQFLMVFEGIRELMQLHQGEPGRRIGFRLGEGSVKV